MEISHGINFFCRVKFEKSNLIKKGCIIGTLYEEILTIKKIYIFTYYIIFEKQFVLYFLF